MSLSIHFFFSRGRSSFSPSLDRVLFRSISRILIYFFQLSNFHHSTYLLGSLHGNSILFPLHPYLIFLFLIFFSLLARASEKRKFNPSSRNTFSKQLVFVDFLIIFSLYIVRRVLFFATSFFSTILYLFYTLFALPFCN